MSSKIYWTDVRRTRSTKRFLMAVEASVCVLLLCLAVVGHQVVSESDCEVQVPEPWPTPYLFVPRDSVVRINCTPTGSSHFWAIDFADDGIQAHFRPTDSEFDGNGFYELPPVGMPTTLRLLINDTSRNNGTEIICSARILDTTLIIFEPTPLELEIIEVGISAINVSWTNSGQLSAAASVAELNYSLTISYGSTSHLLLLNESHHIFKAPPGSPPCQIYNFSVTTTPGGATYTGDSCSVPSPVLSMMLPSLPNATTLESTVNYSLRYGSDPMDGYVLTVHFKPADFCESYPVTAYMLLVEGTTNLDKSATSTNNTVISVTNLPANDVYTFHLVVSNDEGNVSINKRTIYTTDVQMITVMPTEGGLNTLMVQCYFVSGSIAGGCMVVLVGELGNTIVNLTRDNSHRTVNTSYPISCYSGVFGYDIESDGSIGTLAVPGVISNAHNNMTCDALLNESSPNLTVIVSSVVGGIAGALILSLIVMIFICLLAYKRSQTKVIGIDNRSSVTSTHEAIAIADDKELDQAMPVYAEPINIKQDVSMRTAGDGADHSNHYNSTTHTQESPDKADDVNKGVATYAELKDETDHVYHVLEKHTSPRGVKAPPPGDDILPDEDAPELPPPYNPALESQSPPPLPVYHDINDLPPKGAVS